MSIGYFDQDVIGACADHDIADFFKKRDLLGRFLKPNAIYFDGNRADDRNPHRHRIDDGTNFQKPQINESIRTLLNS